MAAEARYEEEGSRLIRQEIKRGNEALSGKPDSKTAEINQSTSAIDTSLQL